ncbi:MAG: hypothetical protein RI907_814 [Pseudomonadota bacterium]|jgi:biopolymer transport protein TolR
MADVNVRGGGRRRRTRSEINMVPFIDVMLVLLIIFMVSAPLMPTAVIDLPSIGKARQAPEKVVELVLEGENEVRLRINRKDVDTLAVKELVARIKPLQDEAQGGGNAVPVIISARKDIQYEWVVKVMDALQKGGVVRVGLSVRTTGA